MIVKDNKMVFSTQEIESLGFKGGKIAFLFHKSRNRILLQDSKWGYIPTISNSNKSIRVFYEIDNHYSFPEYSKWEINLGVKYRGESTNEISLKLVNGKMRITSQINDKATFKMNDGFINSTTCFFKNSRLYSDPLFLSDNNINFFFIENNSKHLESGVILVHTFTFKEQTSFDIDMFYENINKFYSSTRLLRKEVRFYGKLSKYNYDSFQEIENGLGKSRVLVFKRKQ